MCTLQTLLHLGAHLFMHLFFRQPLPREVLLVLLETDAASLNSLSPVVDVVLQLMGDDLML